VIRNQRNRSCHNQGEMAMQRIRKNLTIILTIGFITNVIIAILSYIVGVIIMNDTLPGSHHYGAFIYYFKVAVFVIVLIPHLSYKKLKELMTKDLVIVSMGSGSLFILFSIFTHNLFLEFIQKSKGSFGLLESFSINNNAFLYLGILLSVCLFSFGFSMNKLLKETK
uniref:hypothetical protein n=1 Tax=Paenibacillus alkalitolerans TaxID=2799335 RepID=UPI001F437D8F